MSINYCFKGAIGRPYNNNNNNNNNNNDNNNDNIFNSRELHIKFMIELNNTSKMKLITIEHVFLLHVFDCASLSLTLL